MKSGIYITNEEWLNKEGTSSWHSLKSYHTCTKYEQVDPTSRLVSRYVYVHRPPRQPLCSLHVLGAGSGVMRMKPEVDHAVQRKCLPRLMSIRW